MTLRKGHIFVLTSRAQQESKELYWRSTLQLLQERKIIALKSSFSPALDLPSHLLSLIAHFLPVFGPESQLVEIWASLNSQLEWGFAVVYSPPFEECSPVPPRPESRLLQCLECIAQLWFFCFRHRNEFWAVQQVLSCSCDSSGAPLSRVLPKNLVFSYIIELCYQHPAGLLIGKESWCHRGCLITIILSSLGVTQGCCCWKHV